MKRTHNVFSKAGKDKPLHDFQRRLDNVLNNPEKRTYLLELNYEQVKQVYEAVLPVIETSIYAEMEYVMVAVRTAHDVVMTRIADGINREEQKKKQHGVQALGGHKSFSSKITDQHTEQTNKSNQLEERVSDNKAKRQAFIKKRLAVFMDDEETFHQFIKHIVTNYQSLQKQRIDVLMIKNSLFQKLESYLFDEVFLTKHDFQTAYQWHNQLVHAFYTTFDDLLFDGEILDTDEKINEQVIDSVLKEFEFQITSQNKGKGEDHNGERYVLGS